MRPNAYTMEPPEPLRTEILMKLIALVKPTGGAVWCGGGMPSIRMVPYGDPEAISWVDAAALVGVEWGRSEKKMKQRIREKLRQAPARVERKRPATANRMESDWNLDTFRKAQKQAHEQFEGEGGYCRGLGSTLQDM